jgi:hypothetical protein
MSWRRSATVAAAFYGLFLASACGGSSSNLPLQSVSPTAPTAPTPTNWSVSGRITSQSGAPIPGAVVTPVGEAAILTDASGNYTLSGVGQPSDNPYSLQVTGNGYLRRQIWVLWQQAARTNVNVDLISLAAPFSLPFYRELARDAMDEPGALQPLSLWPGGNPKVYVRTVDQNGEPVDPLVLSSVYNVIGETVSDWTDGRLSVQTLQHGTETRQRQDGWLIVNFVRHATGDICGQAFVGALDGQIELVDGACTCGTSTMPKQVVAHEVGHAMGFFHVSDRGSLMYPQASRNCTNINLSSAERVHSKVAWTRKPGNLDPDLDPAGAIPLARRDILVVN